MVRYTIVHGRAVEHSDRRSHHAAIDTESGEVRIWSDAADGYVLDHLIAGDWACRVVEQARAEHVLTAHARARR